MAVTHVQRVGVIGVVRLYVMGTVTRAEQEVNKLEAWPA